MLNSGAISGPEHIGGADDVIHVVENGNVVGQPLGGVGSKVVHGIGANGLKQVIEAILNRTPFEANSRRDVLDKRTGQVIDNYNLVSLRDKYLGHVRPDESCPSCDNCTHYTITFRTVRAPMHVDKQVLKGRISYTARSYAGSTAKDQIKGLQVRVT